MKRILLFCCCLPSLFALVSYNAYGNLLVPNVDIYETAYVHANGSGKFEIAVDLAKVESLIKLACFLANVTPEVTKQGIQEAYSRASHSLEDIPGISNVTTTCDADMLNFSLCFQFDKISALNEAIRVLYGLIDHPGATHFKMDRHAFSRTDTVNAAQLLAHYRKSAESQHEDTGAQTNDLIIKNILNVITYHIAYSFDREIKEVTNTLVSISEDSKKIILTQPLADVCAKELSFNNRVTFS